MTCSKPFASRNSTANAPNLAFSRVTTIFRGWRAAPNRPPEPEKSIIAVSRRLAGLGHPCALPGKKREAHQVNIYWTFRPAQRCSLSLSASSVRAAIASLSPYASIALLQHLRALPPAQGTPDRPGTPGTADDAGPYSAAGRLSATGSSEDTSQRGIQRPNVSVSLLRKIAPGSRGMCASLRRLCAATLKRFPRKQPVHLLQHPRPVRRPLLPVPLRLRKCRLILASSGT